MSSTGIKEGKISGRVNLTVSYWFYCISQWIHVISRQHKVLKFDKCNLQDSDLVKAFVSFKITHNNNVFIAQVKMSFNLRYIS